MVKNPPVNARDLDSILTRSGGPLGEGSFSRDSVESSAQTNLPGKSHRLGAWWAQSVRLQKSGT